MARRSAADRRARLRSETVVDFIHGLRLFGQKQTGNPPMRAEGRCTIALLDEGLAALDSATEDPFKRPPSARCTVTWSVPPSLCSPSAGAQYLRARAGRLVERGTHSELLGPCHGGLYQIRINGAEGSGAFCYPARGWAAGRGRSDGSSGTNAHP